MWIIRLAVFWIFLLPGSLHVTCKTFLLGHAPKLKVISLANGSTTWTYRDGTWVVGSSSSTTSALVRFLSINIKINILNANFGWAQIREQFLLIVERTAERWRNRSEGRIHFGVWYVRLEISRAQLARHASFDEKDITIGRIHVDCGQWQRLVYGPRGRWDKY